MTIFRIHLLVLFAAIALVIVTPNAATAQGLVTGTRVTFDQAIEIPGHVLSAGTYSFVQSGSAVVQVWDENQKLLATLITNAAEQPKFAEHQEFEFKKSESDKPLELKAWFLDSGLMGHEFMYSK